MGLTKKQSTSTAREGVNYVRTLTNPHEIMNKIDQKQQLNKYAYLYCEKARHCEGIK